MLILDLHNNLLEGYSQKEFFKNLNGIK